MPYALLTDAAVAALDVPTDGMLPLEETYADTPAIARPRRGPGVAVGRHATGAGSAPVEVASGQARLRRRPGARPPPGTRRPRRGRPRGREPRAREASLGSTDIGDARPADDDRRTRRGPGSRRRPHHSARSPSGPANDLLVELRELAAHGAGSIATAGGGEVAQRGRDPVRGLEQHAPALVGRDARQPLASLATRARQEPLERPARPRDAGRGDRRQHRRRRPGSARPCRRRRPRPRPAPPRGRDTTGVPASVTRARSRAAPRGGPAARARARDRSARGS